MQSPRPILHAFLPLLFRVLLLPTLCASTFMPGIPVCSSDYGPIDNIYSIHAIHLIFASSGAVPNPDFRFPKIHRYGSTIVGVELSLAHPSLLHALNNPPPWTWHRNNLDLVRRTCVDFLNLDHARPRRGGWMYSGAFYYVIVNAPKVGDLGACLRLPGMSLEMCTAHAIAARAREDPAHAWEIRALGEPAAPIVQA
ncbi:hypothetical protein MMC11_006555 [Xylographa trunciseda]|nr:hypothetical protein [Xylographa trunciseda]